MRIKEILKTDSLAGSRIVINNNFKAVKNEFGKIDEFFIFDEDDNRIGLKSPLLRCNNIEAETIKNIAEKELVLYRNELPCLTFNQDGHVIIRKDRDLNLDLQETLEKLASTTIDVQGIANQVKAKLLEDSAWLESLKLKLISDASFINQLISKILNNSVFKDQVINWIEEYAPEPKPDRCTTYSIYSKFGTLWLHCSTQPTAEHDMKMEDYIPVEGDTMTIEKANIQPMINEYWGEQAEDEEFSLTYTDAEGNERKITEDGEYDDYNSNGEIESHIVCEDFGGNTIYKITKLL